MRKHARKGLEREEESWYRERKGAGRVLIAKSSWLSLSLFLTLFYIGVESINKQCRD